MGGRLQRAKPTKTQTPAFGTYHTAYTTDVEKVFKNFFTLVIFFVFSSMAELIVQLVKNCLSVC